MGPPEWPPPGLPNMILDLDDHERIPENLFLHSPPGERPRAGTFLYLLGFQDTTMYLLDTVNRVLYLVQMHSSYRTGIVANRHCL